MKKPPPTTISVPPKKIKPASPVIRFRIEITGDQWKIVKRIRIPKMTLPKQPDRAPLNDKAYAGFWAEVTDKDGKFLYRVHKQNPLTGTKEVVDRKGKFVREPDTKETVILDLLIPEITGMEKVRFYSDTDRKGERLRDGSRMIHEMSIKES